MTNIVKNNSTGYGYSYASLSDIAKQGYEIPKMCVRKDESGEEYVWYWDETIIEDPTAETVDKHHRVGWVQGAKVVIPENERMNKAQLYGAALTYARRYTALLALQLACEDDKTIEDIDENGERKTYPKCSKKQAEYLEKLYDAENIAKMLAFYKVEQLSDLNTNQANEAISKALKRNEKHNQ